MKKMKNRNNIIRIAGALVLAGALWSCQADMDAPGLEVPEATIQANTTIAELKTLYESKTSLVGFKDEATKEHFIIHGRVVSSDASGNIDQNLVIQDETAALTFSMRERNLYTRYRLGQEVVVDMTGLYIGYYRGLQQVGAPGDPYNGLPQLGFMTYDYWLDHAQCNGLPDPAMQLVNVDQTWPADKIYCLKLTLPISNSDLVKMQSQLVEVRNVHFVQAGKTTYAPRQETVSRYLKNEAGDSLAVRLSGYSNFYNDTIPEGTGCVRGILGYFNDSWQITPRDRNDIMIGGAGSEKEPYSVTDILNPDYEGVQGWTAGYIVGSVKAGVSNVTGNDDIIFGKDAELDNNLVIAADKECRDWSQCAVVELPQRTLLRNYANLLDHPDNYLKKISVQGTIGTDLGRPAITECAGKYGTFSLEGLVINPPAADYSTVYFGLDQNATSIDWTFDNVELSSGVSYVWSWKLYDGAHYLNGSAYVGGSPKKALAYAVSPVIDLKDKLDARVHFSHAAKFQTTLRQLCGFAVREEGQSAWVELPIPIWPSSGSWNFVDSGFIDLSGFAGKKIQIAFKYGSDTNGADTWEVRNVTVEAR